jgi:DNA polymerase elongation subunit (family B)
MITKTIIENTIYIDVETCGAYPSLKDAREKDLELARLWEKRCKWLIKNVDEGESTHPDDLWRNRASLHPEFGKIICVTLGVFTSSGEERITTFYGDDEKDILEKTNKILQNSRGKGFNIAGLNIKNFDIPYIGKRMLANKINPDPSIQSWNKKPWELSYIDLADVFSFGAWGHSFSSLELISHTLGVESSKGEMDGSDVHDYYWFKDKIEDIKEYCERDVICTMKCFKEISDL